MSKTGKVWLVGAGPGDEGLLTLKAKMLLEEADVIVYDALVSMEILSRIPPGKQMIYAGKRAGNHPVSQTEINKILFREAKQGKKVVRLKGGDPFIFGRGGEELELLAEEGIPFEVVPGITSASAVPAYAGIPVTHRDFVSSFHVVTAHPRENGCRQIDFKALVRAGGTLVFLMGASSLSAICQGLLDAGMEESMPAAVIEKGTTARQRRITASVEELAKTAETAGVGTPAIILVGQVCGLEKKFGWSEKRILGGRRFLITRPRESSSEFAVSLRALGAQVIELPTIETRPIPPGREFKETLEEFGRTGREAWLLFTSPAGVRIFFAQLREMGMDVRRLFRKPAEVKVGAIGSATEEVLSEFGIFPEAVPKVYCAQALGELVAEKAVPGSQVLVLRAREGSGELLPPMQRAGLIVKDIGIYETVYRKQEHLQERLKEMFQAGEIDAVTFTSGSTVRGFAETFAGNLDLHRVQAICIGEQTAVEAAKYGMQIQVAEKASIESMVEKIVKQFGRK